MVHHTVDHPEVKAVALVTRKRTKKVNESAGPAAEAMRREGRRGREIEIRTGKDVQGVATDQVLQGQNQEVEVLIKKTGNLKAGGLQLLIHK